MGIGIDILNIGPNHSTRIVETGNARFIENGEVSGSLEPRNVEIQEVRVLVHLPLPSSQVVVPVHVDHDNDLQEVQINDQAPLNVVVPNEPILDEPQEVALRRSVRERRSLFLMITWFIYKSWNTT